MKTLLENWNKYKLTESTHKLKDFAQIKTNFEDADFWITRKGSSKSVGKPTTIYSPEHIGVKVTATDKLDPKYLKYMIEYLWSSGKFAQIATGTTALVSIRTDDIKNIGIG
jgi:hypothetical protein